MPGPDYLKFKLYMEDQRLEFYHHGILGQKWGVRRYQNKDGSLTPAGMNRYGRGESMDSKNKSDSSVTRKVKSDYNNLSDSEFLRKYKVTKERYRKRVNKYGDPYKNSTPLTKIEKENRKIDQGKMMYENGKRLVTNALLESGALMVGSSLAIKAYREGWNILAKSGDRYGTIKLAPFIAIGTAGYALKKEYENERLQKYYFHRRK